MKRSVYGMLAVAAFIAANACSDDVAPPGTSASGASYIRVINSIYTGHDTILEPEHGPDTPAVHGTTMIPQAVDVLIDSSSASPGVLNLAPNSITMGDSANGYGSVAPGVKSFVVRRAGDTHPNSSLYSSSANIPFLARLRLTPGRYHTLIVSGIIPDTGTPPFNAVPFNLVDDDHFPGATVNGVTNARLMLLNVAPFTTTSGAGTTVRLFMIPNPVPANWYTQTPFSNFQGYGCQFGACTYKDLPPGSYTAIVSSQSTVDTLASAPVTVVAGEVVTLVLQSTGYSATPGSGNTVLRVLRDHQY